MGSNMAENHPVAFRWPMKAKLKGAKLIHVDPRFTRTSAMCDIYAPIRAGSDIAFLGGLVNYVINSERWNREQFFQDFLVHYTNAPMLISDQFQDTEDLDGVFSGLMQYKGGVGEWPFNGFVGEYNNQSWQYAGTQAQTQGWQGATARSGEQPVGKEGQAPARGAGASGAAGAAAPKDAVARKAGAKGPPFEPLVRALLQPPARKDETLKNPRCVFQIVKRHFGRYTPEMVERVTGCPRDTFLKVAETILANSGAERTTSFAHAVAWTQHTNGPQVIGCCALLQLLLGNIGRPGGGIMALRGYASIQGSTDIPTLYHSIHGYMSHPSALKQQDTLIDYLAAETRTRSYWANLPTGIPTGFALLAIAAEFLGPLGLAVGLLTRVAAFGIAYVMLVAIITVHWPHGFFINWYGNQKGEGIEYHLLALGIAITLMIAGAGAWSLDGALASAR
jgi:formate dehydrogenase major subunit